MKTLIHTKSLIIVLLLWLLSGTVLAGKYTGLTATASSGTASVAVDNNMETRWESVHGVDPQWIIVDLGEVKNINAIKIYWEGANAKDYSLSFSDNGIDFAGHLYYSNMSGGSRNDVIIGLDIDCRYIKMNGTARNLTYGYSIWELEVYPNETPVLTSITVSPASATVYRGQQKTFTANGFDQFGNAIAFNAATTWNVAQAGASITNDGVFSSTQKGVYTITATNNSVSKSATVEVVPAVANLSVQSGVSVTASTGAASFAVDNNAGTRWESVQSADPQWIKMDFGAQKNVTDIVIKWETASAKDYTIEYSDDDLNWTTLVAKTNMSGVANRIDSIYNQSFSARYIKINGTVRTTSYGYSIWELQVFGTSEAYYRTKSGGNWSDISTWETSTDNLNWTDATTVPTNLYKKITVSDGDELLVSGNVTASELEIQPAGKITINQSVNLNTSVVNILSSSSGTGTLLDNGTLSLVTANVQQYLPQGRNWYITSPVAEGNAAVLNTGTEVRTYNELTKNWDLASGALTPGKGYVSVSAAGTGTSNVVFSGVLNTGDVHVPLTRSGSVKAGFNLVGNPYPSYLDWTLVAAANPDVSTTMWFRTKTNTNAYTFSTYNALGNVAVANNANTTVTKYIPPMQAFWVRVNPDKTSTDFMMTNAMRSHADVSGNRFKAPADIKQKILRLSVTNGINTDETVIYFNANASNEFDGYDSNKMSNSNSAIPEIFTVVDNQQLVINGLKTMDDDIEIPLGFSTGEANLFKIKTTDLTGFNEAEQIVLKDKLLHTELILDADAEYEFSSDAVNTSNRFSIQFRSPSVTTENDFSVVNSANIYLSDNKIIVDCSDFELCTGRVSVYSVLGQNIVETNIVRPTTILDNNLSGGVYFVVLKINQQVITKKIIVK